MVFKLLTVPRHSHVTLAKFRPKKTQTAPFCSYMSKNDILFKKSISATAKKWLDIFEKSLKYIKSMDNIYHFINPKFNLIKML